MGDQLDGPTPPFQGFCQTIRFVSGPRIWSRPDAMEAMTSRRLLATDIDGTFIGDTDETLRLWHDLRREGILMAFSSGRHLQSIRALYHELDTPWRADACVCMVGTEIWHLAHGRYRVDEGWSQIIGEDWDRESVQRIVDGVRGSVTQPDEWQSRFKVSYFLDGATESEIDEIRARIARHDLRAKVVYSADRFLDVLPARSGKGEAVRHLAETLRIGPANVVTAGDTGNDLDMMRPSLGFRSIAVGNATEELRSFLVPSVYQAHDSFAAGIREGLIHYGWLQAV